MWYENGKLYDSPPPIPQSVSSVAQKMIALADVEVLFFALISILLYAINPEYMLLFVVISSVVLVMLS
jgi:hypothetical protein